MHIGIVERIAADYLRLVVTVAGAEGDAVDLAPGHRQVEHLLPADERNVLFVGHPAVKLGIEPGQRIAAHAQRGADAVESVYDQHVPFPAGDTAGGDEDTPEKTELEARLVAQRVRRLLEEGFPVTDKQTGGLRPVTAGDIVILLRSPKGKARTYIAALERVGVTATAEQRGGLLETNEVGTIVSLLNVIDNPRQDVDLIGVMLSPLFGFSADRLALIRALQPEGDYYDALCLDDGAEVPVAIRG